MGAYQLSLHGSLPSHESDGTSRGSNGGSKSSRGGKQRDFQKGVHRHNFFQSKRAQNLHSPPRHSTACCDGLSERREIERRLSTIVPLQDFHCMGHSFRSEDSESLALWEEIDQPVSIDHGWMNLTRSSPRWLEAMRKFDTTKLAPWRSSPVHPKTSLDGQRLSLSDRKGSMKSFHESAKAPWYSNATKKFGNGESRSVRSPLGASHLSRRSGELIPSSGELLIPPARIRSNGSMHENSSRKRGTQFITEEAPRLSSSRDISPKPELVVKKECIVNGVSSGIPADGRNVVQTEGAHEEVTKNATTLQLETTTKKNTKAETDNKSASRNSSVKAMDTSTCEADILSVKTSKVQEKEDEASALAPIKGEVTVPFKRREEEGAGKSEKLAIQDTSCNAPQSCPRLAMPSSEQDDDTSPYEALRQRYILKSESEPLDGNLYVIQPRTPTATSRACSVITKGQEVGMSSESCLRKSRSFNDADEGHSSRVETSLTPNRLFASLCNKVFRSSHPGSGKKKYLGDFLESSSPRSILCGLADEGSLPSSNPSLRSDPGMPVFSALPTAASQSYSSSGASFDLNEHDFEVTRTAYNLNAPKPVESRRVSLSFRDFGPSRPSRENTASKLDAAAAVKVTPNTELLGCEDDNETHSSPERILTPKLWTATFSTDVQESRAQPDSPCAATARESAYTPCNTPPARRLSNVSPSESEDRQMSSVVLRSRPRHCNDFTARLGMFSPRRLISKCEDSVSSNRHNCFVASSTLSPPHDGNLGDRSPAYESTLELLALEIKERKLKSKSQFSNRRHSSADSSDAPTMMISINKAMKKILSKCTVKRSNSKGKSKMESPGLATLPPADFHFTEAK